jgi:beta-N-acetylhexosaminidase
MDRLPKPAKLLSPRTVVAILGVWLLATAFQRDRGEAWAEKTLEALSLRDKIAQLVQIRVPGTFTNRRSPEFRRIASDIREHHVGGLVLFAGDIYESAVLLNELQGLSRLPLLVASDFERGAAFRISDTTPFPWAMALGAAGDERLAREQGRVTARESRALGVHWIFAPVVDVNSNPDNPVINIRSFGEDPETVARLGAAFIRGAREGGVMTTAKHFPGHGDTAVDSHIGLPVIRADARRLHSLEFVPFKSAIAAGVDSIMTAHVAVPAVTGDPGTPATLSGKVLTDTLRGELGFEGLVVTDALEMAGVTGHTWGGRAAVAAIAAGADVLLLPTDALVAINEVERAVRRGEISEARIDGSVRRILEAKSRMRLHLHRRVEVPPIGEAVAAPESLALAQEIADRAVTVVRDDARLLPLDPLEDRKIYSLVLTPELDSSPASVFQAELRRRFPSAATAWANARIPAEQETAILRSAARADVVLCSIVVRLASGKPARSVPAVQRRLLAQLAASPRPVIWIALGNPYVLELAPPSATSLCTFSYSDSSQIAAARALAGAVRVAGRMPVTIPGYADAGSGVEIPKLEMVLERADTASTGFPPGAFDPTRSLLRGLTGSGVLPGVELVVGLGGRIVLEASMGRTGSAPDAPAVGPDTIFDLDALSGPVAATMAAVPAMEDRGFDLRSAVADYVPEAGDTAPGKGEIRDLFASLGGPETAGAELFAEAVSRSLGVPWSRFVAENLLAPLGMKHTSPVPPPPLRGKRPPLPLDLYSTAGDLATWAQMLLNRGLYAHHRYAHAATFATLTGSRGPWSKPSGSDWTAALGRTAFGHNAPNGSFFWADPSRGAFAILLANGRKGEAAVLEAQGAIGASVLAALPD